MSKVRVRSLYQRRILNWLLDNIGSVSEISKILGIRTPHTSLALNELRKKGLVHRDDAHGIRGAMHSITESGRISLEEYRLELYRKYVTKGETKLDGVVLESKGVELLLCYHHNPPDSLIPLPMAPFINDGNPLQYSNGSDGVIWASVMPDSVRWYDGTSLEQIVPPGELSANTLDAWIQTTDSFALVRATLFEPITQWNVPPGTRFHTPNYGQHELPDIISDGRCCIGSIPRTELEVFWNTRLHAHLNSEIDINLLISSFSDGAYVMRKNPIKPDIPSLPIGSIYQWLRFKHKRLSESKITAKFEQIKSLINTESAKSLSISMQKQLARDFGYCDWVTDTPRNIEVSNVSTVGLKSIITHLKSEQDAQYIVEWDWDIDLETEFLENMIRDSNCRLLVTKSGTYRKLTSALGTLISLPELSMTRLILPNQQAIDIQLTSESAGRQIVAHSIIPKDGVELLKSYHNGSWDLSEMSGNSEDFNYRDKIWQALGKYPKGDEMWSNEVEANNPIAAWIASPPEERTNRWVRISHRLEDDWADLLDSQTIPPSLIVSGIDKASENWQLQAIRHLSQHFMTDNQTIIDVRRSAENREQYNAISTAVLLICDKLPKEFSKYIQDAVDEWLDFPLFAAEVLAALFSQSKDNETDQFGVFDKVILASAIHPKDSVLHNWGRYVRQLQNSEPISNELMRSFANYLPYRWWFSNSLSWLKSQLSSSVGRRWLESQVIPWPGLIFRQDGESCGPPGFPLKFVRELPKVDDLLFIPIMQDCPAKDFLMDVYDLAAKVEDSNYRITPRSHPKLQYLLLPVEEWPDFTHAVIQEGEVTIGSLIYGISYHKNMI